MSVEKVEVWLKKINFYGSRAREKGEREREREREREQKRGRRVSEEGGEREERKE